ncbi:MAG TPA: bifunctional serine/threonine-protein kinase/formylglycine-generating enzyme family protein [Planctomycetota bacterium]|nr:bifunctional serine/threonine-protein kinase/formylglycine-generating enzyme family protein [Planctomycetota bacterium]
MTVPFRCPDCGNVMDSDLVQARFDGSCPWCLAQVATADPESQEPGIEISSTLSTGMNFGPYLLDLPLGKGGMGEVWKAKDSRLDRWVALKFLRQEDPGEFARFQREAQTAAGLSHPGIAAIYEVGEIDGRHYIAMQHVSGRTIETFPRSDWRLLVTLLRDAARAVEHAHRKGIIHRDLKPENLIVEKADDGWRAVVLDFGLARPIQGGEKLSLSGSIVGTPAYMSPEQARGAKLDERSDVYSLGASLYEVLTNRIPFEASSVFDTLKRVAEEDPVRPRLVNPRIHRDLETIVLKCMEKVPGRRYGSARELADDLTRFLAGELILARPAGPLIKGWKWTKRHRVVSAVAMAVLVGATGFLAFRSAEKRAKVAGLLREGHDAREDWNRMQAELGELTRQESEAAAAVKPHDGEEKKLTYWAFQKRREEKDREAALRHSEIIVAYTSALGVDPANAEARAALSALYFVEYEIAEKNRDHRGIELNEKLIRHFDDGHYGEKLLRQGTATIDSEPSGAEVFLFRYEEGSDRRLIPRPFRASSLVASDPPASSGEASGLACSSFNRWGSCPVQTLRLPAGSYLCVLRKAGFRDVHYPAFIGRGTRLSERVKLYTDEEIGPDYVYVPSGPFIMGEDSIGFGAAARKVVTTGDFFLRKTEVTFGEYLVFVNDVLAAEGLDKALHRTPRETPASNRLWTEPPPGALFSIPGHYDPQWPVVGIAWEDAEAYCKWLSRRDQQRGGRATYRLPSNIEWEKAARGADGRFYPWGNHFDWSFTKGQLSRQGYGGKAEPIGTYLKDESPYGVRDMAGSVREWCHDWKDNELSKYVRGGNAMGINTEWFRCSSRAEQIPWVVNQALGFRPLRENPGAWRVRSATDSLWVGQWIGHAKDIFGCRIQLSIDGDLVEGAIEWTPERLPGDPRLLLEDPAKAAELLGQTTGIETLRGTFDSGRRSMELKGVRVTDPKRIGIDWYRIVLSENGETFEGSSRGHDRRWESQFTGKKISGQIPSH